MGTRVVHLLGKELTGEAVGTGVKRSELVSVIQRYESVADNMAPFYHRNFLQEEFDDYTEVERLMLPLSNDGKTVNIILSLLYPHWAQINRIALRYQRRARFSEFG